ncbi:hypothetical protein [Saprospira grandis]|uniref:Uncharacterized protein n=1 Tax=Saprospira grandis (strain Lewin) TaxID=984262 RepID=H6L8L4_SAPGL|nr:hypothetical protein [Saprospira grandis]AFC26739.1 hypothetical protein SGRA_4024 [Saprospira grandis str. Lewin]
MSTVQLHKVGRFLAPILALLLLCGSVGWSSYSHFCACQDSWHYSIWAEASCCRQGVENSAESCCSILEEQQHHCSLEQPCCQDNEVEFFSIWDDSGELLPPNLAQSFGSFQLFWAPRLVLHWPSRSLSVQEELAWAAPFIFWQKRAPLLFSGADYLQFIQIMRC